MGGSRNTWALISLLDLVPIVATIIRRRESLRFISEDDRLLNVVDHLLRKGLEPVRENYDGGTDAR